jgi:hypothetical protein
MSELVLKFIAVVSAVKPNLLDVIPWKQLLGSPKKYPGQLWMLGIPPILITRCDSKE